MSDLDDSDFSSEVESSDDDLELMINEPRMKNERYLEEIVPAYSDVVFFEHFRLNRETVNNIRHMYEDSDYYKTQRGQYGKICAEHQVLIYLWYIGHQTASFRDVADRFDITISLLNRIINRLTLFLSNLSGQIIKWPNENEKRTSEEHFRNNGFPGVIGAIDGCHIKIDKPSNDPDSYINRKCYYSIQMQCVCNEKHHIIDVFIGYPGSVHDSRVFNNSQLKNTLVEKCGRYFLLGDSGYPLQSQLLTPYKNFGNLNRRQQNYNNKLAKNRYVIEHCFGILKQKFRQLYHIKLRSIRLVVHFIRAVCVLHNLAIEDNFEFNPDDNAPNFQLHPEAENEDGDIVNAEASAVRNRVANSLQM